MASPTIPAINQLLVRLHPYPFERLRELTRDVEPNAAFSPISLGIGEPRHATLALITDALTAALPGLTRYSATLGEPALREVFLVSDQPAPHSRSRSINHAT